MNEFKLQVLIVEDSLSFAIELEMLVEEIGYYVVGRVDNSTDALTIIHEKKPDFILMDIDIKGRMTGVELGAEIKPLNIPILFITSFGDDTHYKAAQQSNMVGYLVKPIDKYSLRTSIQLAVTNAYIRKQQEGQTAVTSPDKSENIPYETENFIFNNCLFFKKRNTFHKVKIDEIIFIRSNDNYCETYIRGGEKFLSRIGISKIEKMLPSDRFVRIHRQYIIQLDKIDVIDFQGNTIKVEDHEIPISRTRKKLLEKMVKQLN